MKIYRPIKSNFITQLFGEDKPCCLLDSSGKAVIPYVIKTSVNNVCPIGYTKFYPVINLKGHNGVDFASYTGEPVYFNVEAPVEWEAATEIDKDGGIGVRVRSKQPIPLSQLPKELVASMNLAQRQYEAQGGKLYVQFVFWHLSRANVYDKQPVRLGQLIGFAGSTGASSGPHVHFAPKATDATSWFTIDSDNGYSGAFDPMPWFENKFVLDVILPPKQTQAEIIAGLQRSLETAKQILLGMLLRLQK